MIRIEDTSVHPPNLLGSHHMLGLFGRPLLMFLLGHAALIALMMLLAG